MQTPLPSATSARDAHNAPGHPGDLALAFHDALLMASRLNAGQSEATDAQELRNRVKAVLADADAEARRCGYDPEYVKLAMYAVIALTDEAVLGSQTPGLASWAREPLQQEIFGDALAGERFFDELTALMSHPDSAALADLLEVYQLCLFLGFRGKYASTTDERVRAIDEALYDRIARIRGAPGFGSGAPADTGERVRTRQDPWLGRLGVAAIVLVIAAGMLFVFYRLRLGHLLANLRTLVGPA